MNNNTIILPELGKTNNPFMCINSQLIFCEKKLEVDEVQEALDILYPKRNVSLNNLKKWKETLRQFH